MTIYFVNVSDKTLKLIVSVYPTSQRSSWLLLDNGSSQNLQSLEKC